MLAISAKLHIQTGYVTNPTMQTILNNLHKLFYYISLPIIMYFHASMYYRIDQIMWLIYTLYLILYFYICLQKQIKEWQMITAGAFPILILLPMVNFLNLTSWQFLQIFSKGHILIGTGILLISFISQRLTPKRKRKAIFNSYLPITLSSLASFIILAITYSEIHSSFLFNYGKGCLDYINPVIPTVLLTFIPLGIVYFIHKIILKH